jgi:predicted SAM-dependent methyltransferase
MNRATGACLQMGLEKTVMTNVAKSSRRLNLGCGYDRREGYINVDMNDFHAPDVVADVSDLSGFPSDFYEEILAQDVLEHMTREVSEIAFKEWARLLSPTGVMKIRVPSLLGLFSLFGRDPWTAEAHKAIVHLLFGTQAYTGDFHLSGFTPPILLDMAEKSGVMLASAWLKDDWLFGLEFVRKREPTHEEYLHQLYFEVLGRAADHEGYANHIAPLMNGRSREETKALFLNSEEAKARM